MTTPQRGREIVDANLYLVLATADGAGVPWSTPVYFAHSGYAEFFWVSSPERTHSRNIAARPTVGAVVFDSRAPISTGQAVYLSAVAEQVGPDDVERGIDVFSRRSLQHGGVEWTRADVEGSADLRLYRAVADGHWMLAKDGGPDRRIAVPLG